MIHSYEKQYSFDKRLYLSNDPNPMKLEEQIRRESYVFEKNGVIRYVKGYKYKQSGIKSYNKVIGFVLSLVGISSKIIINEKPIYINNKSFSKFIFYCVQLEEQATSNPLVKQESFTPENIAQIAKNVALSEGKKCHKEQMLAISKKAKEFFKQGTNNINDIFQPLIDEVKPKSIKI